MASLAGWDWISGNPFLDDLIFAFLCLLTVSLVKRPFYPNVSRTFENMVGMNGFSSHLKYCGDISVTIGITI